MRPPPLTTDERIQHLARELAEQMADAMVWHVSIEVTTPDRKTFDFGIKDGSPNHRMIFRAMGRDENKWAGAIIVEKTRFKMKNGRESNLAIEITEVEADNPPF